VQSFSHEGQQIIAALDELLSSAWKVGQQGSPFAKAGLHIDMRPGSDA
jgi:hypothetical protein